MKDNALIPKHVDEMHPSVHPEREEFGMVILVIQMMVEEYSLLPMVHH